MDNEEIDKKFKELNIKIEKKEPPSEFKIPLFYSNLKEFIPIDDEVLYSFFLLHHGFL